MGPMPRSTLHNLLFEAMFGSCVIELGKSYEIQRFVSREWSCRWGAKFVCLRFDRYCTGRREIAIHSSRRSECGMVQRVRKRTAPTERDTDRIWYRFVPTTRCYLYCVETSERRDHQPNKRFSRCEAVVTTNGELENRYGSSPYYKKWDGGRSGHEACLVSFNIVHTRSSSLECRVCTSDFITQVLESHIAVRVWINLIKVKKLIIDRGLKHSINIASRTRINVTINHIAYYQIPSHSMAIWSTTFFIQLRWSRSLHLRPLTVLRWDVMTLYDCTELLVLRMTRWRGLHFPMAVYFSVPNSYAGLAFQLQTVDDRPSSAWRPRRWWGRYTTPTGAAFALQCCRRLFVALAKLLSGPTGDLR